MIYAEILINFFGMVAAVNRSVGGVCWANLAHSIQSVLRQELDDLKPEFNIVVVSKKSTRRAEVSAIVSEMK